MYKQSIYEKRLHYQSNGVSVHHSIISGEKWVHPFDMPNSLRKEITEMTKMEKPEVTGLNAVCCIADPGAAAFLLGSAAMGVWPLAITCNVPAVIATFGIG